MSQKLSSKPTMQIKEQDLFTYYLQKNFWAKGISYEQVMNTITEQGIEIIDKVSLEERQNFDENSRF